MNWKRGSEPGRTLLPVARLPEGVYPKEVSRCLFQRKLYWTGQMLRRVREHKEAISAANKADRGSVDEAKVHAETEGGMPPQPQERQKPPGSTAEIAETGTAQQFRHGPKPDYETAFRVAEIVGRVAGEGSWRSTLDAICLGLDEAAIPFPKTWKKRGYHDWFDCLSERSLVQKAIVHHLELAKRHEELSPNFRNFLPGLKYPRKAHSKGLPRRKLEQQFSGGKFGLL